MKELQGIFSEEEWRSWNISFDKEDEVVKKLDGVVGWLTLFGNFYAVRKMSFETSMSSTIEEGKKIMIDEFKQFLEDKSNKQLICDNNERVEGSKHSERLKERGGNKARKRI